MAIQLQVNGKSHSVDTEAQTPLLYALRNDCDINSAKYGCGAGQCGACTVVVNGNPIRSCITPVSAISGNVTTLENYQNDPVLNALNKAFITEQAAQCGFCIAGMMMSAKVLLDKNKNPSDTQIKSALNGNLCRCGTYSRILKAVKLAVKELA
ncbi:oxidoreductase [Polynucleobacter sp. SHI8]|uniref:(2Fe-2S)-binding protein n=1 Tax=unclassified Polynucleobacter TaxID=2640945 RepID=UPI0024928B60|nr:MULTISPECIES: (2Fe-2S)-binding protein [unclassified Polynucleobacter]BDW11306.1 oxidoreductase [Polynucleobacter sp. SHI2]BDW13752.1 oxidoreductase [Polynucleobacter sp. SHI8]